VKQWFDRAKQLGGEYLEAVLVGNKIDLPSHFKGKLDNSKRTVKY
jgi:GTPase SAR1 family protein